ncbi:FadR/GntR family transcriptional regulator [Anaerobacillus isosaccharinicus]|uniref:Transcriptional regulator n=1 Tax=Anaerobacillus isosaccharinicus TaxID=1532552 RepID=A0A1S2LVR7_9BACI|nr:FadR/GntR family transcriptional regulator [Anaerobacillus isosaccharinicus]MBA5587940.1 FadR family transcriptional regulator [Anaerobacillus isosaccharinicus]QOY33910.1 FadR family transcriptional regulator [Anaerobacillus isosaccharinicus]
MSSQQEKIYIEIIRELNHIIQEDELKTGDKLPSERELSERLNVGRSSVREALRSLELLDLIETRRGEGTFIKSIGGHRLVEVLASFFLREKKARNDLAETRKIVEIEGLRLACERIDEAQLQNLEKLIEQSKKSWDNGDFPVEEDYLFHKTIVEACHNSLLLHIWISLVEYSKVALRESLSREGRPEQSIKEHIQIYTALKSRNEEEAIKALRNHLENSRF